MDTVMEPNVQSHANIASSTVILKTSFGLFGNSRKVPTSIIAGAEGTSLLKVQKTLLESPELADIKNADAMMKIYLKAQCLPYESGLAILPLGPDGAYLKKVHLKILDYAKHRETLVDKFIDMYSVRVQEARNAAEKLALDLGVPIQDIWRDADYPDAAKAREEFYFTYGYHSFNVPPELVLAGVYDEAKSNAENKLKKATDEITAMMRQSVLDLVGHLNDILTPNADGKKKRLHATAVTNIAGFIEDFKARNIVNDTELQEVVDKLGFMITPGFDVDMLKDDGEFREKFHNNLAGIQEQLTTLVEQVPGRKFKDL
jgi:hypothetical protein